MLRIFVDESDKHQGKPLYELIVLMARDAGLAGATVIRSLMGYGAMSHIHTAKILRLSDNLPMIVEIIDSEAKIQGFLPELDQVIEAGLVVLERVQVIHYRREEKKDESA